MRIILAVFLISQFCISCNVLSKQPLENPLLNKTYVMVTYRGLINSKDSFPAGMPIINFGLDTQLSGKTGCNSFMGSYKIKNHSIKLDITGMTKMFCLGVDETGYISVVQSADSFRLNQKTLTLFHSGKAVMELTEATEN